MSPEIKKITPEISQKKELTPFEKKELKEIEEKIEEINSCLKEIKEKYYEKVEIVQKRFKEGREKLTEEEREKTRETLAEMELIKKEVFEKLRKLLAERRKLEQRRNEILGIEEREELKFEVKEDYFEKEEREEIKGWWIHAISSFNDFVFAGRNSGYFTLYKFDPKDKKMKIVKIENQEKLLSGSIFESKMNEKYLAVSGDKHDLKIYSRKSKNPEDWFKEENTTDLSDKFKTRVSGLDINFQGLVGAGSWDSRVYVYDLENEKEILNQKFREIGSIYTFKFIPKTDYAIIAGTNEIEIINYKTGKVKWKKLGLSISKAVSLSPDNKEIAFTKDGESDKIYFLDISNIEELKPDQEPEEKQVLDENGKPTELLDNWRLFYTPDGKYLVIGSWSKNHLIIINRRSMKIVKEFFNFGEEAIFVDEKENIIAADESKEQLVYID